MMRVGVQEAPSNRRGGASAVVATGLGRPLWTFAVGELLCGVPIADVREIVLWRRGTRVPLAPKVVEGLINLRDHIVMVIDLRCRLGLPERSLKAADPTLVVVQSDQGASSLLVDEIGEIVAVPAGDFESPSETLRSAAVDLIDGAYKLEKELLLVLDVEKTLNIGS
jgi:purine-binding chemotaxis protein CheW